MTCSKNCKQSYRLNARGDNFICSGVCSKPSKYKHDNIWLCLKGEWHESYLEMTREEALHIITALGSALCQNGKK